MVKSIKSDCTLKKYDIITINLHIDDIKGHKYYLATKATQGLHIKFNRGFIINHRQWLYGKFYAGKVLIGKNKSTRICFYYNLLKF